MIRPWEGWMITVAPALLPWSTENTNIFLFMALKPSVNYLEKIHIILRIK